MSAIFGINQSEISLSLAQAVFFFVEILDIYLDCQVTPFSFDVLAAHQIQCLDGTLTPFGEC